jgi:hypothetical protein
VSHTSSVSTRLDATRRENRELRQELRDAHVALPYIPAVLLSAIAELALEISHPTRTDDGVRIRRTETERHGPPTNRRAAAGLKRVQAVLTREGARLCGNGYSVGELDQIIHGHDRGLL